MIYKITKFEFDRLLNIFTSSKKITMNKYYLINSLNKLIDITCCNNKFILNQYQDNRILHSKEMIIDNLDKIDNYLKLSEILINRQEEVCPEIIFNDFKYIQHVKIDEYELDINIGKIKLVSKYYDICKEFELVIYTSSEGYESKIICSLISKALCCCNFNDNEIVRLLTGYNSDEIIFDEMKKVERSISDIVKVIYRCNCNYQDIAEVDVMCNKSKHIKAIEEYFEGYAKISSKNASLNEKNIFASLIESDTIATQVENLFYSIDYVSKSRITNDVQIITKGDGFKFYDINGKYIIGRHAYSIIRDSLPIYYLYNNKNKVWNIIVKDNELDSAVRALPRAISIYIAYLNKQSEGLNLHGASVVLDKEKSIVILGDKKQGKTTNMINALASCDRIDFQTNDFTYLRLLNELITLGTSKTIGIRLGTIQMMPQLHNLFMNKESLIKLKSTQNGYNCNGVNEVSNKDIDNNYSINFTPKELVTIFNKNIIPKAKLSCIVKPIYDKSIQGFKINSMSEEEKVELILNNCHEFYCGNEQFWDVLLSLNNNLRSIDYSEIIQRLKDVPALEVRTNKNSLLDAWNFLIDKLM